MNVEFTESGSIDTCIQPAGVVMKFAKYWRDVEVPVDQRLFGIPGVSVWGASNISTEDAKKNALSRARHFEKLAAEGFDRLREYEYWNGFIREEVLEEVCAGDGRVLAVLTRNSYGATVLNTETVLFGDIDVPVAGFFTRILEMFGKQKKDKDYYLAKIGDYQKSNPRYTFRVYETFAGLRFIITNQVFAADSSLVKELFAALEVDPLYMHLCKHQTCFRARLSPKPWRVGVDRPGSRFPRESRSDIHEFESWLRTYQLASAKVSVVKLLATFGSDAAHRDIERVMTVHDRHSSQGYAGLA
jgi:hypothetical protein